MAGGVTPGVEPRNLRLLREFQSDSEVESGHTPVPAIDGTITLASHAKCFILFDLARRGPPQDTDDATNAVEAFSGQRGCGDVCGAANQSLLNSHNKHDHGVANRRLDHLY